MRVPIKDLFLKNEPQESVVICGWVRSLRKNKNFSFMVLNDGSTVDNMQIIVDADVEHYDEISSLLTGSCVKVEGKLVTSQGKGQSLEMQARNITIFGKAGEDYPLQKKATSLEFLRDNAHLRPRTNLFGSIFRIRHEMAMSTHRFFNDRGFYYLNSPILTTFDAEGAGEMFTVTTMDPLKDNKNYEKDYFNEQSSLCVTGQLEGECFAMGMGSIYTFGPTFRAENSNTPRHLSEFWMIEPEVAFMDLAGNADLAEAYIKSLIKDVFANSEKDLEAICRYHQFQAKQNKTEYNDHRKVLETVLEKDFERITYTKAIEILTASNKKFEFKPDWGVELQTEHERFLAEEYFKGPVVVTDYPKDIKSFYMKQNDDGKTVGAMDVLVPGVGEIIGGSEREADYDKLCKRVEDLSMEKDQLWWYLDLRKFGTAPHSGFGLGFERAIRYITDMNNIRDVIPFPRTPGSCSF